MNALQKESEHAAKKKRHRRTEVRLVLLQNEKLPRRIGEVEERDFGKKKASSRKAAKKKENFQ